MRKAFEKRALICSAADLLAFFKNLPCTMYTMPSVNVCGVGGSDKIYFFVLVLIFWQT